MKSFSPQAQASTSYLIEASDIDNWFIFILIGGDKGMNEKLPSSSSMRLVGFLWLIVSVVLALVLFFLRVVVCRRWSSRGVFLC